MQIKRDDLKEKYYSMNNEKLAEELGISVVTLLRLIDKSGIKRKGTGNHYNRKKIEVV